MHLGKDNQSTPLYRLFHDTCADFPGVSVAFRQNVLNGPKSIAAHQQRSAEIAALWNIELLTPAPAEPPKGTCKVAFWNIERCKYVEASAARLAEVDADVNLLCEMDLGMARSSQRHTTRDLAEIIGQGYAFAVEFVELNLGDESERARHTGEENSAGLHGNAILSKQHLTRPVLIRLDEDGQWFGGQYAERRLGGRIAIAATIAIAGVDVVVLCTHFESRGDPETRAAEMRKLLAAIDDYAGDRPVILAGDFNTNTTTRETISNAASRAMILQADPDRFADPVIYEPMFEEAAAAGWSWGTANVPGTTQRPHTEPRYECKLDWLFARGLKAWDAEIISAVDADGCVLSDHDMITVMIAPENPS